MFAQIILKLSVDRAMIVSVIDVIDALDDIQKLQTSHDLTKATKLVEYVCVSLGKRVVWHYHEQAKDPEQGEK